MKRYLWCDIDSTVNDHWRRIKRNTDGTRIYSSAWSYDEIMKDEPLHHAVKANNLLFEKYNLSFVTARGFDGALRVTQDWLNIHKFKYNNIVIVKNMKEKVEFILDTTCHILIDDMTTGQERCRNNLTFHIEHIARLARKGIRVVWNINWDKILKALI